MNRSAPSAPLGNPTVDRNSPEAIRVELLTRPLRLGVMIAVAMAVLRVGAEWAKGTPGTEILAQISSFLPLLLIPPLFTTAVALAVRHLHLNARFDEHVGNSTRRMQAIEDAIATAQLANHRIAALEPHLRDEEDFAIMVRIATEWRSINTLIARVPELQDLVQWKLRAILHDLWTNWQKLGNGGMLVSDSDQEIELNALILRLLKPRTVRAVSWNDEAYWRSAFGKAFLVQQKEYLCGDREREVRRVFFTKPAIDYSDIFAQQIAAGITVRQIGLDEIARAKRKVQDVVIYDGRCLKESKMVGQARGEGEELKEAELFFMAEKVDPAIRSFDDLWEAASGVEALHG